MANQFRGMSDSEKWPYLVGAIKKAIEEELGGKLRRLPGRGRSNVWKIERNGQEQHASFRTTQNRWIAFPPLKGGAVWKTLDQAEVVFVASVDDQEEPQKIEVYEFPAEEVRQRFSAAYRARIQEGQQIRDNFGMWINLDRDDRRIARSVGSGLASDFMPVAVYPIESLLTEDGAKWSDPVDTDDEDAASSADHGGTREGITIQEAKRRLAITFGVSPEKVEITIRG